jgi:hypothetical protein
MTRDFFALRQKNKTSCSTQQLHKAQRLIESCEHCNPEGAEIPFDNILDRITGSDPSVTDYVLEAAGQSAPIVGEPDFRSSE